METMIEQLKSCPSTDFFPRLKQLCEENGYSRFLIDFSMNEAVFFISGSESYLLLCVAFSNESKEKQYIDSAGFALAEHTHCISPLNIVWGKRDKLEVIRRKYQLPVLPVFLGVATEYGLLNSEKEKEQWTQNGISFVKDVVSIPCVESKEPPCYNKYFALSEYLSAKR